MDLPLTSAHAERDDHAEPGREPVVAADAVDERPTVNRQADDERSDDEHATASGSAGRPQESGERWYRLRWVRIVGWTAVASLVGALGFAYWALDRFVIDDVKIDDVAAFEAAARSSSTTASPTVSPTAPPTSVSQLESPPASGSEPTMSDTGPTADSSVPADGSTTGATSPATATTAASANPPDATTAPGSQTATPTSAAANDAATSVTDGPSTREPVFSETATLTDNTYVDDDTRIEITKFETGSGSDALVYFVADVQLADATQLRSGFAENKFGTNIIANTSKIADDNDALFAINGDYYGFRDRGMLIRNGVVFRDEGPRRGLAIHADGTMRLYDESATTGQQLLQDGVWATLSFGPALVDDGQIVDGIDQVEVDTNFGNHSVQGSHPRTGVGMIAPNHFLFVVVDGRSRGYSRGVTLPEFARMFQELGATEAYNLDGGGSSTMYFNGKLVNNPLGKMKERGTSDILYIAA